MRLTRDDRLRSLTDFVADNLVKLAVDELLLRRLIRAPDVFRIDEHLRGFALNLTLLGCGESGEIGCAVLLNLA